MNSQIKDIWKYLGANKVKYLTIGGFAVNIYGYGRNTGDSDIPVCFLDYGNLIIAKKAANHPKDLLDIEEFEKINKNRQ